MKRRLTGILAALKREVFMVLHDTNMRTILLIAPVFYSLMYGFIYINKTETNVKISVWDEDRSNTTRELIRKIDAHQLIEVENYSTSFSEVRENIYTDDVQGIIHFPNDFEKELKRGKQSTIKLYLNTTRFLPSNDINKGINEVVFNFNNELKEKFFASRGLNASLAEAVIQPVKEDVRFLFNPAATYGDFIIPGILLIILQQTLLIGLSESIGKEREEKTLGELYRISKKSITSLIAGKGMFYLLFYTVYSFFFFTFNLYLFGINMNGSLLLFIGLTILFITTIIIWGIGIASFFTRKIFALQTIALTSYPVFFLSGYAWATSSMPGLLQQISLLIPSTPYFNAAVRIVFMGAGFYDILPEFLHIIILLSTGLAFTFIRLSLLLPKTLKPEQLPEAVSS